MERARLRRQERSSTRWCRRLPSGAQEVRVLHHRGRHASRGGHLLQRSIGPESDPSSVWRKERIRRAFGTGHWRALQSIERPRQQPRAVAGDRHVDDALGVRRDGHGRAAADGIHRHFRRQFDRYASRATPRRSFPAAAAPRRRGWPRPRWLLPRSTEVASAIRGAGDGDGDAAIEPVGINRFVEFDPDVGNVVVSPFRVLRKAAPEHIADARRACPAGNSVQSGSRLVMAPSTSADESPGNDRQPVSISYSTQPNAQISVRRSTGSPRACSGLMYATVPITAPSAVDSTPDPVGPGSRGASNFATPKSSTFTVPSGAILMLAGFRSRWTIPF